MNLHAQHVRLIANIGSPAASSHAMHGNVAYTVRSSLVFDRQVSCIRVCNLHNVVMITLHPQHSYIARSDSLACTLQPPLYLPTDLSDMPTLV